MGAPGVVLPCDTLVQLPSQPPKPWAGLPDTVHTPTPGTALNMNNVTIPSGASTAVTGAPGVVVPVFCDTGAHSPQPPAGLPDAVRTTPPGSARNTV